MLDVDIREKSYRTAHGERLSALGGLRFRCRAGEFVCVTGPSGCGKTTMLKLVLGLDTDFDGDIQRPVGRIAAVFQEPRLLPWRSVEDNVRLAMPPDLSGVDLTAVFSMLGLEGTQRLYPGELSMGMARRVALARAFALQPALLTLDEPFVSLDDATAGRLRKLLLAVWSARPTTVLMVTHNLREAAELADRVIVLSERPGTIVAMHEIAMPRELRGSREVDQIVADITRFARL